jgi:hypothetical protein
MENNVPNISDASLCVICGQYYNYPKRNESCTSEVLNIEECPQVCKNCWNDYSGYRGEKETIYFNESLYLKSISSLLISLPNKYAIAI